jgi:hypothetical protein
MARRESAEEHKARILAAKAVRSYVITHPGCTASAILKATGHNVAVCQGLGLLVCEGGKWRPQAGLSQPWVDAGAAAEEQIDRTVAAVHRKHSFEAVEHGTPLAELLRAEEGDDLLCAGQSELTVIEVKREARLAQLAWIFEKGVDPKVAMRRLYTLAHEVGPQLLRELSHEAMALLLGDGAGRATSSARSQAIFGGLKSALGIGTEFGGNHKTAGARARMSASAMGNKNRRGKLSKVNEQTQNQQAA